MSVTTPLSAPAAATALPLLSPRDLAAPLAWHRGQAISGAQFLVQAQALAARLPAGRPVNLCQNRLHFALGLAAALLRGQLSLLPPNALPETLRQVPSAAGEAYALVDAGVHTELEGERGPLELGALQAVRVAWSNVPEAALHGGVPLLPTELNAVCLLTSGSTGAPQPHAKRWGPLVINIASEAQALARHLGRPSLSGVNVVATVPAQHSYGLESTVLLALLGGAAFDSGRPFYPADVAAALAAVPRPRALVTTPFHLKTLLLAGVALPPVDLVLSATAPLSPQLAAQAEAAFGGVLVEIYGCTEAGQVASRRTTVGGIWTTLGELRLQLDSTLVGADSGAGFVVSGGHVTEPTPLADMLELLDSTHFRLLGRANDLIHVAGKRSSLAHLNFQLNRIPGVDDGVFWLPDETADGVVRPIAFVVAPNLAPAAIVAALRSTLDAAFVPRRVLHVPALPREATGKLTVSALRQFALATLSGAAAAAQVPASRAATGRLEPLELEFTLPLTHPALAGHFPGQPVVPGVVLLSAVIQALDQAPSLRQVLGATPQIEQAKFLAPVVPAAGAAAALRLRLHAVGGEPDASRRLAFEVMEGERTVLRGQLGPGTAPGAAAP